MFLSLSGNQGFAVDLCCFGVTTGSCRQILCVGNTACHSFIISLYATPTGRIFRLRSYKPNGFTLPLLSLKAVSQSTWSVNEYHVKPTTGTPSFLILKTFAHSFQSHFTDS